MTFQEDIKKNMDRKSSLFKPVDMKQGTPWKQILAFMIPMLIGNVAQQLYNTVDSIDPRTVWYGGQWHQPVRYSCELVFVL